MSALKAVSATPAAAKARQPKTVAEYLTAAIESSDLAQKDIATALGYDKPNMITMLKKGLTKLPLNKVGPLAKVLGLDASHLLRRVMLEYYPETWDAIQEIIEAPPLSDNEMEMINVVRSVNPNDPAMTNDIQRDELRKWATTLTSVTLVAGDYRKRRGK